MTLAGDPSVASASTAGFAQRSGAELLAALQQEGATPAANLDRGELVAALIAHRLAQRKPVVGDGVLELLPEGFGFLRSAAFDYASSPHDPFLSPSQVRSLNLQPGHRLTGPLRAPKGSERFFALTHIDSVHGDEPARLAARLAFAARTPVVGTRPLPLGGTDPAHGVLAMLAPWYLGHRVLVVVPEAGSGAGWLADLATALRAAGPDLHLSLCALEQGPEHLATLKARFADEPRTLVVGSTFDLPPPRHAALAELVLARAQRDVEAGLDVVLLFDSLSALTRAAQRAAPASGRWLCPGLDADALLPAKRLFAAARACAEGGSLTVIATAVAATAGPDAAVLAEFRHCGNSEVVLETTPAASAWQCDVRLTRTRPEDDHRDAAVLARLRALREQVATAAGAERERLLAGLLPR